MKTIKIILTYLICLILLAGTVGCSPAQKEENGKKEMNRVSLSRAFLEDGVWKEKMEANIAYIKHLDVDRLLYYYYQNAGLEPKGGKQPYPDWESNPPHLGITTGHYVSACSMLYVQTGEQWYKDRVDYVIGELCKCQQENGYLLAQPISRFDSYEACEGIYTSGVPYYFVHKLLAAGIDAYRYCNNEAALTMASRLADWVYERVSGLTDTVRQNMMLVEYGGMAETLLRLYKITEKQEHLAAGQYFHETKHFAAWSQNIDRLASEHANTSIPKAQGFLQDYLITGNEKMLAAAQNFFDMVVYGRTYPNGGNSRQECFGPKGLIWGLCREENDNPSETCNIYNMIKLAYGLYELTGDGKYMDYIELALNNGIMGSIDEKGCKIYYQFLQTDARKMFHQPDTGFWCCTGTGMENFSKVPEALYVEESGNALQVNIFISSRYEDGNGFSLKMHAEDNCTNFTITGAGKKKLKLRVPYWAENPTVKINGEVLNVSNEKGYFVLDREWKEGDTVEYATPYKRFLVRPDDNKEYFSLRYGPYLLAAVGNLGSPALAMEQDLLVRDTFELKTEEIGFSLITKSGDVAVQKYGLITKEAYTVYLTSAK